MLSSDAIVIRDGKQTKVAAPELVPGDVCILGLGDKVPGDIRMIECNNIATLEAALTGESVPIEKTSDTITSSVDARMIPLSRPSSLVTDAEGAFPESERAAKEVLSLPVYPELTAVQRDEVVAVVRSFFGR